MNKNQFEMKNVIDKINNTLEVIANRLAELCTKAEN